MNQVHSKSSTPITFRQYRIRRYLAVTPPFLSALETERLDPKAQLLHLAPGTDRPTTLPPYRNPLPLSPLRTWNLSYLTLHRRFQSTATTITHRSSPPLHRGRFQDPSRRLSCHLGGSNRNFSSATRTSSTRQLLGSCCDRTVPPPFCISFTQHHTAQPPASPRCLKADLGICLVILNSVTSWINKLRAAGRRLPAIISLI